MTINLVDLIKIAGLPLEDVDNIRVVEQLKENPNAYLNFQYSILKIVHKTGINEKDIEATLEAKKNWKRKLCTFMTTWGLNKNQLKNRNNKKLL